MDILTKIKKAGLVGRGGASFPVWQKWSAVAKAMVDKSAVAAALADKVAGDKKCYVICNASEGEPGVEKDGYILEHWPQAVIDGMKIAINFLGANKGYIYINNKYYKKFKEKLTSIIGNAPIELFIKPYDSGYIGGEESSVLNAIENGFSRNGVIKRVEPRLRPPFPTTCGLWNCPTLINNVETFYNVSLVDKGEYRRKRFYTVSGDCPAEGVFFLPESFTIERVLKQTNNYPKFSFFFQIGGNASGEILNSKQLKRRAGGAGSITVYSIEKHNPKKLIRNWLEFFLNESCGQCTTCREGTYRLKEIFLSDKTDWRLISELLNNLNETSFCGLGLSIPVPMVSFIKNVLPSIKK